MTSEMRVARRLKIFKLGLLGIPQERIAQRLGMEQPLVNYHLSKTSELKNLINEQLKRGFFINTIVEKLGWPEPLVWDRKGSWQRYSVPVCERGAANRKG